MRCWPILAALPLLLAAAPSSDKGFEASGRDPKWSMTIAEKRIAFVLPGKRARDAQSGQIDKVERSPGRVLISATMEEPQFVPMGKGRDGQPVYFVESVEWALSIEVTEAACTDSKQRSFPSQMVLRYGGEEHRGCAGSLAELEAGLVARN